MENQQLIESLDKTVANLKATNEAGFRDKAKEVYGKVKNTAVKGGKEVYGKVKNTAVKGGKAVASKWNNLPKAGKVGAALAGAGALAGAAALAAKRKKAKHESLTEDFNMSKFSN